MRNLEGQECPGHMHAFSLHNSQNGYLQATDSALQVKEYGRAVHLG